MGLRVSGRVEDPMSLPTESPPTATWLSLLQEDVTSLPHGTPGHSSALKTDRPAGF